MALLAMWILASIWFGSDSGISVPGLLVIVGGAVLLLLVWLIRLIVGWKQKTRIRLLWLEPTLMTIVLAAIYSGAFFHLRFRASRRSLDRYVAQTLAAGGMHQKRTNVGLFVVRETEVLPNGVVRIITSQCMSDECGIAFSRMEPPAVDEDRYDHLVGNWWRWSRSW
jgi:cobalamin biosynthesis protein CobD/CbiB